MFAPIPLSERSPLAHAAALARRRMAEAKALAGQPTRRRVGSAPVLQVVKKPVAETAAA